MVGLLDVDSFVLLLPEPAPQLGEGLASSDTFAGFLNGGKRDSNPKFGLKDEQDSKLYVSKGNEGRALLFGSSIRPSFTGDPGPPQQQFFDIKFSGK